MKNVSASIAFMALLSLASPSTLGQADPTVNRVDRAAGAGRVMNLITPALMQVGLESNFFLRLADQIRLTDSQRSRLEEIAYDFRIYKVQRVADLNVHDAEVERLLTREKIDLDAIRRKIRESAAITADVKVRTIESLLQALSTLTHEQHMIIVLLITQEAQPPKSRTWPDVPDSDKQGT